MRAAFILLCAKFCAFGNCYKFPIIPSPQYNIPIVNLRGVSQSIVFMRQNNTDNMVLKSIITSLSEDQTVVILRGNGFTTSSKCRHSRNPNIIIVTERLIQPYEMKSAAFKAMLKSHWSPVYIVYTLQNGSETCDNGKFNETFLLNIEACMSYMWHRYKIVRAIASFPVTCPNHYIIYGDKKETNGSFYGRSIKVVKTRSKQKLADAVLKNTRTKQLTAGYPLRASIFDRFPTSVALCGDIESYRTVNLAYTNGFCGMDALVMNDFIAYYQYNLSIPNDESCNAYGFVDPTSNRMTGSLGCIVNKIIDISFNSRFMVFYTSKHYFYLHYITTDTLAVVLKIPGVIPLWHYAFNAMSPKSGIILSILILILGILAWASAWILVEVDHREPKKLYVYVFNALTCTLFGFPIKRSNRFLVLRATSLICSIILLAFYQGHVNNLFTTRTRYKELKTLNQLYKSRNLLYTSPSIQSLLVSNANEEDEEQAAYFKNKMIIDGSIGTDYVLDHEHSATTARGQDAQLQVLMNYTDSHGSPRMYVLEEPFHVYYLSYICATGFLFTDETYRFMMRLLEAGLPHKYYVWTRRTMKLGDTYPTTAAEPKPIEAIKLSHIRVAFITLGIGYGLASLCFVAEVYFGHAKLKRYAVESAQSRAS